MSEWTWGAHERLVTSGTASGNGIYSVSFGSWGGTSGAPAAQWQGNRHKRVFVIRDGTAHRAVVRLTANTPTERGLAEYLALAFEQLEALAMARVEEPEPILSPFGIMSRYDTWLRQCRMSEPVRRFVEHRPACRVRPTRKAFRGLRARPGARGVLRRRQEGGDDRGEEGARAKGRARAAEPSLRGALGEVDRARHCRLLAAT